METSGSPRLRPLLARMRRIGKGEKSRFRSKNCIVHRSRDYIRGSTLNFICELLPKHIQQLHLNQSYLRALSRGVKVLGLPFYLVENNTLVQSHMVTAHLQYRETKTSREDDMIFKPYILRNAQMMPANGIKRQMLLQRLRAKVLMPKSLIL
jgi:hypothetical protein